MSLNTAQSELIKQTTETERGEEREDGCGGNGNKCEGGFLLPLLATGNISFDQNKKASIKPKQSQRQN